MPQKEVYEKLIFRDDNRLASVSFLLQGVADLIQFMTGGSVLSRSQTFVHHEPRNLQPKPFRQLFDPLKLKAGNFHN